jgi:hypothetical protein
MFVYKCVFQVRAVLEADPNSDCVCVSRPKDGRMTVTKATGSTGCKKVFPQIFVCQVFRWPHIVFHHDIKSSSHCRHPGAIKPPQSSNSQEDSLGLDSDTKEVICVNPYHYEVTPEAETRFKKQLKPATVSAASKPPALLSDTSSIIMTSDDDDESDDEILAYDDDGVDYAKLWDEQAKKPTDIIGQKHEIKVEHLLKEIRFFTLNKESKDFDKTDKELLDKLGVIQDLKSVIMSGDYLNIIKRDDEDDDNDFDQDEDEVLNTAAQLNLPQDQDLMPPPQEVIPVRL